MDQWIDNLRYFYSKIGGDIYYVHNFYKALATAAVGWVAWLILRKIITGVHKNLMKRESRLFDDRFFVFLRRCAFYGLLWIVGTGVIRIFNLSTIHRLFNAVLLILITLPLIDFLSIVLRFLESNIAAKTHSKVDDIIFDLLNKFLGVIVYAIAIILALDLLGVNVMPFITGAGIVGIAIGFAAKDTLSNLIAGVLLIIDRPFEVGDRIEVWSAPEGSSTWGDVIDIGLRATKIRTTDHIVIIIPNNEIMKRDIVNYTIMTSKIRVRINIGISFEADIKTAKRAILKVANSLGWISKTPPPKVVVRSFGESSVDLQLRVWIDDARKRMDTISTITDQVKTAFDDAKIEIPYPKRDITILHEATK